LLKALNVDAKEMLADLFESVIWIILHF
jgi:hypothetical protein